MYSILDYIPISDVVRLVEPTNEQEPVTIGEAAHQCGVASGISFHDEWFRDHITSARRAVENDTGIICYTGTFTWKQTNWPCNSLLIELPGVRPITSITSIQYVDTNGTTQTWGSSNYSLDTGGVKPFVKLAYATDYPSIRGDINGIIVTFVAGYSSVVNVPKDVKNAVLMSLYIDWLYANDDGANAERQKAGYDVLVNRIVRSTYP